MIPDQSKNTDLSILVNFFFKLIEQSLFYNIMNANGRKSFFYFLGQKSIKAPTYITNKYFN